MGVENALINDDKFTAVFKQVDLFFSGKCAYAQPQKMVKKS